jgi:hypothetical protein
MHIVPVLTTMMDGGRRKRDWQSVQSGGLDLAAGYTQGLIGLLASRVSTVDYLCASVPGLLSLLL